MASPFSDAAPAQYAAFRQAIAACDGLLFGSPEYNRGITGSLKNAIDVGSRPYGTSVFSRKPAAVFSGSPGMTGGFGSNHAGRRRNDQRRNAGQVRDRLCGRVRRLGRSDRCR
ncbi:NADPH-dependent FMN reductase, partial [Sphingomonas sp.]|uniref:NADPH-dependent FMN reductase n=1 Tax=Sphingomonas sp. TaxID=28214 RepID=UPI00375099D7